MSGFVEWIVRSKTLRKRLILIDGGLFFRRRKLSLSLKYLKWRKFIFTFLSLNLSQFHQGHNVIKVCSYYRKNRLKHNLAVSVIICKMVYLICKHIVKYRWAVKQCQAKFGVTWEQQNKWQLLQRQASFWVFH